LTFVMALGTVHCGSDDSCGDPPDLGSAVGYLDLPNCSAGVSLTTAGGCTARCEAGHPYRCGDADVCYGYPVSGPDYLYDQVRVDAVSVGPCTIRADMANGRSYEARVDITSHPASRCWASGYNTRMESVFLTVTTGTTDAGTADAPAE
jgi:hypothetical protein